MEWSLALTQLMSLAPERPDLWIVCLAFGVRERVPKRPAFQEACKLIAQQLRRDPEELTAAILSQLAQYGHAREAVAGAQQILAALGVDVELLSAGALAAALRAVAVARGVNLGPLDDLPQATLDQLSQGPRQRMLPPWAFHSDPPQSLRWRMGVGEALISAWFDWWRIAEQGERASYFEVYQPPTAWKDWAEEMRRAPQQLEDS